MILYVIFNKHCMKPVSPNDQLRRLIKQAEAEKRKAKRSRLGVKTQLVDGVRYDSKAEIKYAAKLDVRVRIGEITHYEYHVRIPLNTANGNLVGHYEADFIAYLPDGSREIIDVKGNFISELFEWKARHVKAQYGEEIILIDSTTLMPKKQ